MADRRQLAQGLMMMTPAMREDLAGREQDIQRGKTVELLRRAGKEMYENPIVNTAVGLSPVLGDIQAGVEAYRSAQAGDWGNAGLNAVGMLPFIPMLGKTVWHGSPHTFDKFDLSKIGTGEGAQAYGHGLYLAEARPTAEEYAVNLANRDMANQGRLNAHANAQRLVNLAGDPKYAADDIRFALESNSDHPQKQLLQDTLQHLESGSYANPLENTGSLYKVDLPDEQIAKMLDWDKPLSEQPEILGKLRSYAEQNPNMNSMFRESLSPMEAGSTTGDAIYRTLNRSLDESKALMQQRDALISKYQTGKMSMSDSVRAMNPEDRAAFSDIAQRIDDQKNVAARTSGLLNELGIPGIQYLDQASRGSLQRIPVSDARMAEITDRLNQIQKIDLPNAKTGDEYKLLSDEMDALSKEYTHGNVPEQTRNYVVFSDEIPQILERNGTPLGNAVREYRGAHTAPGPEFGAQLHDLTGGGQMYPDDVYSPNAVRYYGTGDTALDKESFAIAQRMRNKPDEMVDIYRAVPNESDITSINAGDWVTINPNYAKQHGESNLPEGYKILSQKVPAKSVWTNADSIHEYGYWPE